MYEIHAFRFRIEHTLYREQWVGVGEENLNSEGKVI